ncbi:MAG: ABC transporter ATP-binding protein [Verrucomicrobiota bacterium]
MVRVEKACKKYSATVATSEPITALDHISLNIPTGEFLAIMGPSGCGKSTLLHCLGGLDRLDEGSIFIEDKDITNLTDSQITELRRKSIGFVFQFFNLLPTLTVEENIFLPLQLSSNFDHKKRNFALSLIEQVKLSDRRHHQLHQLSGGQMQRAALIRALVHSPKLLLADEPTGNLDSHSSHQIVSLFKKLGKKFNTTIIMVTHSKEIADTAHRTVHMQDGRIVD